MNLLKKLENDFQLGSQGEWTCDQPSGNEGESFVIEAPGKTVGFISDTYNEDADPPAHASSEDIANAHFIAGARALAPSLIESAKLLSQIHWQLQKLSEEERYEIGVEEFMERAQVVVADLEKDPDTEGATRRIVER